MIELKNISNSLEDTLKDSDLQNITINIAESISDSLFEDGLLKDIPILSSIIGLGKTTLKIRDSLFLKKLIYFINEIKDIPPEQREKVICGIENSDKYRLKVGEKLLYILDKADDHEKSLLVGKLFRSFLNESITYDTFLRGTSIIDKSILEDLYWFIENSWEKMPIDGAGEYINMGLFEMEPLSIKIDETFDHTNQWEEKSIYKVKGGDLIATITFVGKKVREALKKND